MINQILCDIESLRNFRNCFGSNPYDYVRDNQAFDRLTAYGLEALPYILEELEKSSDDGLYEYMLALAAEKITDRNFRQEGLDWSTGKQWFEIYQKAGKNAG